MILTAARVHVSEAVQRYAVGIADATRNSPELRLGASPRATLHLVRAAKAGAAMEGRDYVIPDDVKALAPAALRHRVILAPTAEIEGRRLDQVIGGVIDRVEAPR